MLLFELSAAPGLATALVGHTADALGELALSHFPDGESHVRLLSPVEGRDVALLCSLDRPDAKLVPLLLAAGAARQQGARSVGLVAPYLAYMRQDIAFRAGEAVSAAIFGEVLSARFDWLVTTDPHLHRLPDLAGVYSIPAVAVSASEAIAGWVAREVENPVIVGPDEESAQWAGRIAQAAGGRATILRKVRSGPYSVTIDPAGLNELATGTPVIVDDIASSGKTLIEAVRLLRERGFNDPVCAVVHPIFAGESYEELRAAGAGRVVSTNTIAHPSNAIDVSSALAEGIARALGPISGAGD
ncbi:phosphoribosylpyrophosphate synthetase [Tsuneonella deserti]|uniref:Phosphoribosylpyrophosphate synthetase n=2 Tax=Tsuneonella deserti TaxID=2035528 RepID=A0ABQ1RZB0_9SPHN|nr:phosphoribosylpyrophosphate synthetase [Tsuneonella deserti]